MSIQQIKSGVIADDAVTAAKIGSLPAGSVLQVVSVSTNTNQSSTSSSYVALTNLTVNITPTSATSKILINISLSFRGFNASGQDANFRWGVSRDGGSTLLFADEHRFYDYGGSGLLISGSFAKTFLDSPATTSTLTYAGYGRMVSGAAFEMNPDSTGRSTLTLMEIAG